MVSFIASFQGRRGVILLLSGTDDAQRSVLSISAGRALLEFGDDTSHAKDSFLNDANRNISQQTHYILL